MAAAVGFLAALVTVLAYVGIVPPGASPVVSPATLATSEAPMTASDLIDPTEAPPSVTPTPAVQTATPTASPSPTPAPTAVAGIANLPGQVPTRPPGLLIASGAVVTSIFDLRDRKCEFFAVDLELGDTVQVRITAPRPWDYQRASFAYPGTGFTRDDWTDANEWTASAAGRYEIRVCDVTLGDAGAYKYKVEFLTH